MSFSPFFVSTYWMFYFMFWWSSFGLAFIKYIFQPAAEWQTVEKSKIKLTAGRHKILIDPEQWLCIYLMCLSCLFCSALLQFHLIAIENEACQLNLQTLTGEQRFRDWEKKLQNISLDFTFLIIYSRSSLSFTDLFDFSMFALNRSSELMYLSLSSVFLSGSVAVWRW